MQILNEQMALTTISLLFLVIYITYYLYVVIHKVYLSNKVKNFSVEYKLPKNISPVLAGFIHNMRFTYDLISSVVVSLAIKGVLEIKKVSTTNYKLIKKSTDKTTKLSKEEELFIKTAFENGSNEFIFSTQRCVEIKNLYSKLRNFVNKNYKPKYIESYSKEYLFGWAIILIYYLSLRFIDNSYKSVISVILFALLFSFALKSDAVQKFGVSLIKTFYKVLVFVLTAFLILNAWTSIYSLHNYLFIYFITLQMFLPIILVNRTKSGEDLEKKILGFIEFVTTVEKDRMNIDSEHIKGLKLENYEDYLPYIVALRIEPDNSKIFWHLLEDLFVYKEEGVNVNDYWLLGNDLRGIQAECYKLKDEDNSFTITDVINITKKVTNRFNI